MTTDRDPPDTIPGVPPPVPPAPATPPAPLTNAAGGSTGPGAADGLALREQTLEHLARALLTERRRDRRWTLVMRGLWFLLVLAVVWSLSHTGQKHAVPSGPHTALVELRGEIAAGTEASADQLIAGIKLAFEDAQAQAVVLRINSPGGSPVQAGIVYDEIRRLKAKHKKKVYAVVEEICASGAYYIAVAADEIYVDKASLVGSIGVLMDGFGFTEAMAKLGVERRLMTAGENKGMLDPFSPQNEKQRAFAQAMIDQVHQQFIKVVKEGRGKRLKDDATLFSGLFWNGEQAVALGLADATGSLDQVARDIVKAPEVVDYTPKENVAERLAKRFGASIGEGAVRTLRSITLPR
ncbi:MAG: S49 family peptidase [Aquabacterium sp.]